MEALLAMAMSVSYGGCYITVDAILSTRRLPKHPDIQYGSRRMATMTVRCPTRFASVLDPHPWRYMANKRPRTYDLVSSFVPLRASGVQS